MDWFTILKYGFLASIGLNAIIMPLLAIIFIFGRPAFTYALAKLRGKDLLLALQGNGRFKIIPSDYKGLEIIKNSAWLPKRLAFWNWGGVQTALVTDEWGILYDPKIQQAAEALRDQKGIKGYEDLERRLAETAEVKRELEMLYSQLNEIDNSLAEINDDEEKNNLEEEKRQIEEQIAAYQSWLEQYGIDPNDEVVYRAFGVVKVKEIRDYFTDMYPSEIKAHIDENIADIAQQYVNPVTKIGAYVLYFVMAVIGGGIGIYLIKAAFGG